MRRQTVRSVLFIAIFIAWPAARPARASTHTWTGTTSTSWRDDSNWTGGSPAGDLSADLVFPASPRRLHSTDDIDGVSYVDSITFSGSGYTVDAVVGCSIALAGDLTWGGVNAPTGQVFFAIPIALHGSGHSFVAGIAGDLTASFFLSGPISGSGILGFRGGGGPGAAAPSTFVLTGDNPLSGEIDLVHIWGPQDYGSVNVTINGHQPASAVDLTGCALSGRGQIGPLHSRGEFMFGPTSVHPGDATTGILSVAGDAVFDGSLPSILSFRINGPNAGVDYDQLLVNGNVSLSAVLDVSLGFSPAVGQAFTLVKSTGQITGQFENVVAGRFWVGCMTFQVEYTQNEVTLTRISVSNLPSASSFNTVTPCRILDTRGTPDGPLAGPSLRPGAFRRFPISSGPCGVPADAKAVSANMTVANPAQAGSLTLYAADETCPPTSSISFNSGQTRANNVLLKLSADGTGSFYVISHSAGAVDFILDVNGYFK